MKPLVVAELADAELREAARWYEDQQAGLGQALVEEVDKTLACIAEAPNTFPRWISSRPIRKLGVERFPYVVFYVDLAEEIRVLAIAHGKRKPGYWLGRR